MQGRDLVVIVSSRRTDETRHRRTDGPLVIIEIHSLSYDQKSAPQPASPLRTFVSVVSEL